MDMFGTCGSPCHREIGWFRGGGKNHLCSKNGLSDQTVPPECGHFFDHLQITSILAHMISCTNNARFPRFCIFLNFFEFIMPSRLTAENIGLCLKGTCMQESGTCMWIVIHQGLDSYWHSGCRPICMQRRWTCMEVSQIFPSTPHWAPLI